jgi:hypothetical protein
MTEAIYFVVLRGPKGIYAIPCARRLSQLERSLRWSFPSGALQGPKRERFSGVPCNGG